MTTSRVSPAVCYGPPPRRRGSVCAQGGGVSEDDGYLVCFVHDEAENQSECQIIDAQDITAGPVAAIIMPFRVPYGFHAGWVGAANAFG